jgi:hypothetical protein
VEWTGAETGCGGADGCRDGSRWSGRGRRHGGAGGSGVEQTGAEMGRGGAVGGGGAVERTGAGAVAVECTLIEKNEDAEEGGEEKQERGPRRDTPRRARRGARDVPCFFSSPFFLGVEINMNEFLVALFFPGCCGVNF